MLNDPQDPSNPNDQDHTIYTEEDDDLKHQAAKSPAVLDEENTFLGHAPEESVDIDQELEKVGLRGDFRGNNENVKPLGVKEDTD